MEKDLSKTFWSDAALSGLILGLILFALTVISMLTRLDITHNWIPSTMSFAAIATCIYVFGKKRAAKYGDDGFTFGQSMGYLMMISLFAGFITGVGNYLLQNYISPEYYQEVFDTAMIKSGADLSGAGIDAAMSMTRKLMKSSLFMIMAGIFNMAVYGCFIGLLASIFIKKDAKPTE